MEKIMEKKLIFFVLVFLSFLSSVMAQTTQPTATGTAQSASSSSSQSDVIAPAGQKVSKLEFWMAQFKIQPEFEAVAGLSQGYRIFEGKASVFLETPELGTKSFWATVSPGFRTNFHYAELPPRDTVDYRSTDLLGGLRIRLNGIFELDLFAGTSRKETGDETLGGIGNAHGFTVDSKVRIYLGSVELNAAFNYNSVFKDFHTSGSLIYRPLYWKLGSLGVGLQGGVHEYKRDAYQFYFDGLIAVEIAHIELIMSGGMTYQTHPTMPDDEKKNIFYHLAFALRIPWGTGPGRK